MNWLRKLMYGRYGVDQLSWFLLAVYMLLTLLSALPHLDLLAWVAVLAAVWMLYRVFSRQFIPRRAENARFLHFVAPFIHWCKLRRTVRRDKDHCYFKCPNCGQHLRVPKGKGRITVSCRSCGISFEEKS